MTREQEINAQFPDATKKQPKEEKPVEKYYPPDQKEFTRKVRLDAVKITVIVLVISAFLMGLFYAVVYGPSIDNYLTPIK